MIELRPYQYRGVADIRCAYGSGRKSVLYTGPTGMGKGVLMAYIAHGTAAKSNRICILVHRQELVRQTCRALANANVHFGVIAPGILSQPELTTHVAMVQTLVNRPDAIPPPNLLMIDEAHHLLADSYLKVIARYPNAKILGLTATPQRLDGKGLGSVFEQLVIGPTVQELIDAGFLCRPKYFAPPTDLDMTGVRRTAGDFNRGQTAERVNRPTITGSAVEHYQKICPGVPAVAFCASVKHAEHVRDQFIAAGIPAASIDGTLSDDDRIDRVAALTDGRIKVLTSVDVVSEGFDLPAVTAAILLRPTESLSLHLQAVGRVLRPSPRKDFAYVLDHVGNCMRHGLAEENRTWTLDGKVGKKKSANGVQTSLLTCKKCFTVHVPAPCCPACGDIYPTKERTVAQVDGQLAVLTAALIEEERKKQEKRMEVGRAKTLAELKAIAKERGYSVRWPAMMMGLRARKQFKQKIDQQLAASAQPSLSL